MTDDDAASDDRHGHRHRRGWFNDDVVTAVAADLNRVFRSTPQRLDLAMAAVSRIDSGAWAPHEVALRFDQLAADAPGPGADELCAYVFGDLRFMGNATNYYAPSNSLIHRVLARRSGIPLTLAVVAAEIARRCGGTLAVIGFPGHVILGDGGGPERLPTRWFDPFSAGIALGRDDLQTLLSRVEQGSTVRAEMLMPMTTADIVIRTLNNLANAYQRLGMLSRLVDVFRLRVELDVADVADRRQLAGLLGTVGRHDAAARVFEELIEVDPENGGRYALMVDRLLAHRN